MAAIGPATKKAIEQGGIKVDVVPKEYVAESVVRSLRRRIKGKRVLLVRAKVARDVIPRELRQAGAQVDVVEAYETVVPQSSRARLRAVLKNTRRRPHLVTFTSSSTVRNFVELLEPVKETAGRGLSRAELTTAIELRWNSLRFHRSRDLFHPPRAGVWPVDIEASEFTIPGLVKAIVRGPCCILGSQRCVAEIHP